MLLFAPLRYLLYICNITILVLYLTDFEIVISTVIIQYSEKQHILRFLKLHASRHRVCKLWFITTHIRRKVLFSQVSVCPQGGGGMPHLHPVIFPVVPCPFWGSTPSPSHNTSTGPRSFPPLLARGVLSSSPRQWAGRVPSSQNWMGLPHTRIGWGYHPVRTGWGIVPARSGWGYPWPKLAS